MSKYHSRKTRIDGHEFDSKAEAEYFLVLKSMQQAGVIVSFKLQPKYELQPAFTIGKEKRQPISYIADFEVKLPDGQIEVIDVKGLETEVFRLKKKLFEYKYPELKLVLMVKAPEYGGWMTIEQRNAFKRQANKAGKQLQKRAVASSRGRRFA